MVLLIGIRNVSRMLDIPSLLSIQWNIRLLLSFDSFVSLVHNTFLWSTSQVKCCIFMGDIVFYSYPIMLCCELRGTIECECVSLCTMQTYVPQHNEFLGCIFLTPLPLPIWNFLPPNVIFTTEFVLFHHQFISYLLFWMINL